MCVQALFVHDFGQEQRIYTAHSQAGLCCLFFQFMVIYIFFFHISGKRKTMMREKEAGIILIGPTAAVRIVACSRMYISTRSGRCTRKLRAYAGACVCVYKSICVCAHAGIYSVTRRCI